MKIRYLKKNVSKLTAIVSLTGLLLACGSSESSDSAPSDVAESAPSDVAESAPISETNDWALRGAAAAGESVSLKEFSAGILHVLEVAESDQRCGFALADALDHLGMKYREVDGAGNPTLMAEGMDTLLQEGHNVIFLISVEPGAVAAQLKTAKDKGVTVINMCGTVRKNSLLAASPVPSDYAQAALASQYILDLLYAKNNDNPSGEIAVFEFPGLQSLYQRVKTLEVMIEEFPGVKIVARHEVDFANADEDIRGATLDMVSAFPNLSVIYTLGDFMIPSVVSALQELGKDIPIVSAQSGSPSILKLIEAGKVAAVVDPRIDASGWIAVDTFLNQWAYSRQVSDLEWQQYQSFFEYKLITAENVLADYEMRPGYFTQTPVTDFVSFFKAKWSAQFGL